MCETGPEQHHIVVTK